MYGLLGYGFIGLAMTLHSHQLFFFFPLKAHDGEMDSAALEGGIHQGLEGSLR